MKKSCAFYMFKFENVDDENTALYVSKENFLYEKNI